jgi:hypothetical protein
MARVWKDILLISVLIIVSDAIYIINSPRVTNWGSWSALKYCPSGQFVNGMRLKVESIRKTGLFGYNDNTALNAIELLCGKIGGPFNLNGISILPSEGGYGNWGTKLYCPENTFVTGFQLRSDVSKGTNFFSWFLGMNANDDTAANNLRIFCSQKISFVEGYGTTEGYWTSPQHCLERQAICGFRTQIESYKNNGTFLTTS